ncbi:uncharacterized protein [Dendrobates tinctorius]|uniref:uncharacterized protein isoform X5 n=1 Tax=Dendrobates tinctorius TaxID=92724 RepID=UPI003CC9E842
MREMKPAAVVLLLLSVCAWCRGEEQITKVSGSVVTFRVNADVRPSEITWLKNENKIVELEEGREPDFYPFYDIKDRVGVNLTEKTFTLQAVTPEDSGAYKAVLLVDDRLLNDFFSLRVLDPVCNVSIQNTIVGHNVTLSCSCSSGGARPSQYKWQNGITESDQQILTVSMGKEPKTLWCVASNEVSSSNATVTVPHQVPDLKERSHSIIAAVLVILIVFIGLVLNYACLLGFCHRERQLVPPTDPEDPKCEVDVNKPGNGAESRTVQVTRREAQESIETEVATNTAKL